MVLVHDTLLHCALEVNEVQGSKNFFGPTRPVGQVV